MDVPQVMLEDILEFLHYIWGTVEAKNKQNKKSFTSCPFNGNADEENRKCQIIVQYLWRVMQIKHRKVNVINKKKNLSKCLLVCKCAC